MKFGAYDFITKPFMPDQLRLVVRRALEKRALEIEAKYLREEREKGLKDIAMEKSRIQTIIHCMASGVLVTDRDQMVVLHNPALTHLFKITGRAPGRPPSARDPIFKNPVGDYRSGRGRRWATDHFPGIFFR